MVGPLKLLSFDRNILFRFWYSLVLVLVGIGIGIGWSIKTLLSFDQKDIFCSGPTPSKANAGPGDPFISPRFQVIFSNHNATLSHEYNTTIIRKRCNKGGCIMYGL